MNGIYFVSLRQLVDDLGVVAPFLRTVHLDFCDKKTKKCIIHYTKTIYIYIPGSFTNISKKGKSYDKLKENVLYYIWSGE